MSSDSVASEQGSSGQPIWACQITMALLPDGRVRVSSMVPNGTTGGVTFQSTSEALQYMKNSVYPTMESGLKCAKDRQKKKEEAEREKKVAELLGDLDKVSKIKKALAHMPSSEVSQLLGVSLEEVLEVGGMGESADFFTESPAPGKKSAAPAKKPAAPGKKSAAPAKKPAAPSGKCSKTAAANYRQMYSDEEDDSEYDEEDE